MALALFGLAFYWIVGRMAALMDGYFEPFQPRLLKADLEKIWQSHRQPSVPNPEL
jgi:hypothetical protein